MKNFTKTYGREVFSILVIVMLVSLAGCSSATPSTSSTTNPVPLQPGIGFFSTSLQDLDDAISGVDIDIYVRALNLTSEIITFPEQTVIYYYDVIPPTEQNMPATTSADTYIIVAPASDTPAAWKNIPPGMHTFSAQLVNKDYTPLNPPVIAQSTVLVPTGISQLPALQSFTVQSSPPVLSSLQTTTPVTTPIASYQVTVAASIYNFRLNDDHIGGANVPGEGHYIYYVDADPPINQGQPATTAPGSYRISAASTSTWAQVPLGNHTLSIQLVNNDNTPLNPPVFIKTMITLPPEPYLYIY